MRRKHLSILTTTSLNGFRGEKTPLCEPPKAPKGRTEANKGGEGSLKVQKATSRGDELAANSPLLLSVKTVQGIDLLTKETKESKVLLCDRRVGGFLGAMLSHPANLKMCNHLRWSLQKNRWSDHDG